MNRLVIIGNGFDLAHGLKTSYKDFIEWYWEHRFESFIDNRDIVSSDCLCSITIKSTNRIHNWSLFAMDYVYRRDIHNNRIYSNEQIIDILKNRPNDFLFEVCPFFDKITKSIETKGWVDIENEYYSLLKKNKDNLEECTKLNNQLNYIQDKLVGFLETLSGCGTLPGINNQVLDICRLEDIATNNKSQILKEIGSNEEEYKTNLCNPKVERMWKPKRVMFLSFNYTFTVERYNADSVFPVGDRSEVEYNYIHGDLAHPQNVIFGYGDELDKDFKTILDANDNELLKHSKNNLYLETNHYRKMLEFIESAPFQVYIMGHSCGLSDRTLLNTIFEHDNCVSIKPYYHKKEDGSDNYLELVQNISRSFKDMKLYRARVVNKEQCEPLPQVKKTFED